ncbi:hypothetical protein [Paraburkholderia phenoliruptrix]|uniref:hypothetical protein n=1 Tax=Paraburkholderia phenoliruptrix TaxID=252970 RepID=UPI0034CFC909
MANMKHFADFNGQTMALTRVTSISNAEFAARFPGVKGIRDDGYSMRVGFADGVMFPLTRVIEYKAQPSRHECNAKCMNGSHRGVCECRCGGRNHGRGMFTDLLAAA